MPASERRSAVRSSVVWEALRPVLEERSALRVLDVGGGTGGFAVRVAELGHEVTVVDPSPDALAALARRAHEREVVVVGRQGDLSSLWEVVEPASVDVVLCHGVLEISGPPAAALDTVARALRPGGTLSLLVAQRHAAVVARAMAGHFQAAQELLAGEDSGRSGHRFTQEELAELVSTAGLHTVLVHGIRVFSDLVPGSLLDLEPGASAALLELERTVAERPEYLPLAAQLHVLARR